MSKTDRLHNKILERLPEADYRQIVGQMERVTPKLGEVVAEPGVAPKWVHFPVSGGVVLYGRPEKARRSKPRPSATREWTAYTCWPTRWPTLIESTCRCEATLPHAGRAFKQVLHESHPLSQLLMRYCAGADPARGSEWRMHSAPYDRRADVPLAARDGPSQGQDQFHLTQEFLADMLGVRRQSVNLTARVLQQANLIKYHRGELTIVDRAGLEDSSCECFRVTSQMYERSMRLP